MGNSELLKHWCQRIADDSSIESFGQEPVEDLATAMDVESWAESQGVSRNAVSQSLADCLSIKYRSSISGLRPSALFVDRFPIGLARDQKVLGLEVEDGVMPLAIGGFDSISQIDNVARFLDCEVAPFVADPDQIVAAINAAYQNRDSQTAETIESLDTNEALLSLTQAGARDDLLDSSGRSPVIRLVNSVLFDAVLARASDIHIQPYEEHLQVRFRIDGVLFDQFQIPKTSQEEVLSRLKIIGEMNIAEKRLPQDGRASVQIGDRMIDLRIASLPTSFAARLCRRCSSGSTV